MTFAEPDGLVQRLRAEVADDLVAAGGGGLDADDRRELARHLVVERLRRSALDDLAAGRRVPGPDDELRIAAAVLDALFGLGRLQSLIDDPSVENIDVNGADNVWVTRADGSKHRAGAVADSDHDLIDLVRSAAARLGMSERRFDTAHPELDLRLPDGSRLSAVMSVTRRPVLSVRRHRYVDLGLWDLVDLGTVDDGVASFLAAAVRARKNIVVGGAMNTGKTTMLRALAAEIPPQERIVTIEQAFELGFDASGRHPDMVALEARPPNTEGEGAFPMARLVRRALRMNADRVIVGEVLGDEVIPMLNAMSQGRAGSMCTIHANSSRGVFRRIASYAVQAPERLPIEATNVLIAGAIDLVVYLDMVTDRPSASGWPAPDAAGAATEPGLPGGADFDAGQVEPGRHAGEFHAVPRRRCVSSVLEVVDADGLQVVANEIFRPSGDGRAVPGAPLRTSTLDELVACGFDLASMRSPATRVP